MKALIAAFALLQPGATPPCITTAEVEHATLFLIPPVLEGLGEQCRPSLPAGAYLLTGGAELSRQLAAERTTHWNAARSAIVRFAGEDKAGMLSADTAGGLIRDLIRAEGGKKIKAQDCATLDRALALLAPLPPQNLAGLVSLALETGLRPEPTDITVGPAPAPKGKHKSVTVKPPKDGAQARTPMPIICPAPPQAPASGQ